MQCRESLRIKRTVTVGTQDEEPEELITGVVTGGDDSKVTPANEVSLVVT